MASTTSIGQSLKLYQCDPCRSEGKQNDAEFQCINCEEALCSICRDAHKKFPKLRDHEIQQLSSNPPICTTCKSSDIVREAGFFCKDCDEYLCDACKNDHKKFKKLRGHVIEDVKEQEQENDKSKHTGPSLPDISRLRTSGPEIHVEALNTPPTDGSRNGRGLHATAPSMESHSSAESKHSPTSTSPSEPFDILNISIQNANVIKLGDKVQVFNSVFLPSGDLLLINGYIKEVLHLDSSFTVREKLKIEDATGIGLLSENIAVVTSSCNLEFLEVTPTLRIIKSVPLCKGYATRFRGVAAGGGFIYISCTEGGDDKGHIRVLDINGKEIRRIDAIKNDQVYFYQPDHLVASTTRVYISGENAVTCFKSDGTLVYHYKNERMGLVTGMYVDSEDNVLTCLFSSKREAKDKFHLITANGKQHTSKTLETSIKLPDDNYGYCITIRPHDRTLAMGSMYTLLIFKMA